MAWSRCNGLIDSVPGNGARAVRPDFRDTPTSAIGIYISSAQGVVNCCISDAMSILAAEYVERHAARSRGKSGQLFAAQVAQQLFRVLFTPIGGRSSRSR